MFFKQAGARSRLVTGCLDPKHIFPLGQVNDCRWNGANADKLNNGEIKGCMNCFMTGGPKKISARGKDDEAPTGVAGGSFEW